MNDETKEILDNLRKTADNSVFVVCSSQEELDKIPKYTANFLSVNHRQAKLLLDYITNLQQKYNDNVSKYEKLLEKYFNMRHRVDNAIDYIVGYNLANSIILERSYADLLKILQGESNE